MQHHPTRVCRIPQRPITCTASGAVDGGVVLLSAHAANVDIWRLPAAQQVRLQDTLLPHMLSRWRQGFFIMPLFVH